jgi:predicted PurR-regulated permease PerM
MGRYMRGTFIVGCCDAGGIGLGMLLLGIPHVLAMMAVLVVAEYFPMIGVTSVSIVVILMGYGVGGVGTAVGATIICLGVGQFNAHFTSPYVLGQSVDLPPVVTLLGVTGGTMIAGFADGVLSLPVIAVAGSAFGEIRRSSMRWPASGTPVAADSTAAGHVDDIGAT